MEITRANPYKSAIFFLFARKKYIDLAMRHFVALNIERENSVFRSLHAQGLYPAIGWETDAEVKAKEAAKDIDKTLLNTFLSILACSLVACLIGFVNGKIHSDFGMDYGLGSIFVGTFLASWATFIALSSRYESSRCEKLHELLHPVLFKLIFISGIFFIFLGLVL